MKKINSVLIDLPMSILTPRLLLRPPKVGEGHMLNAAILESFETLNKFMLWASAKPTLEESEEVVRRAAASWIYKTKDNPELMLFILDRNSQDLIGATGFHNIDWEVPYVETGYWVRNKYAGCGYITEAINAITQYAFKVIKTKRIAITCDIDNERSKKIPERLHYKLESIVKSNRLKPVTHEITDTLVYARTDLIDLPELQVSWCT